MVGRLTNTLTNTWGCTLPWPGGLKSSGVTGNRGRLTPTLTNTWGCTLPRPGGLKSTGATGNRGRLTPTLSHKHMGLHSTTARGTEVYRSHRGRVMGRLTPTLTNTWGCTVPRPGGLKSTGLTRVRDRAFPSLLPHP